MTDPLGFAIVIRMNPCRTQGCKAWGFNPPSDTSFGGTPLSVASPLSTESCASASLPR